MQLGGLEQCEPGALSVFKEHTTTRDQLSLVNQTAFSAQGLIACSISDKALRGKSGLVHKTRINWSKAS